jgi:hypothetical protein
VDLLVQLLLVVGVAVAAVFNYFLNLAPGSEPQDFEVLHVGSGVRCDCFLNTLILGGIVALAMALSSSAFSSRTELYAYGFLSFALITLAGIMGRLRRHREWRDMDGVLERVLPEDTEGLIGVSFDDEDKEDDSWEYYDES